MIKRVFIFLVMCVFLGGCGSLSRQGSGVVYQNPIGEMTDIGDPYVLKVDDVYYMYATSLAGSGFLVWESDNLVDWDAGEVAYSHNQQSERWATGDFWAPEVIEYNEMFYMIFSARAQNGELTTTIATSDSPKGPFLDQVVDIIGQEGSFIDGHMFIDDDSTPYLYYVRDNYDNYINGQQVSQIYVQEMSGDLLSLVGDPVMIIEPDQEWENPDGNIVWNEGPFVVKSDSRYYLMYSANFFASSDYAIGYAVSDSPTGPFVKSDSNPILSSDLANGISGPGHNSITVGLDNETLYAVYHIHTDPNNPSGDRRPAIDRLYFDDGKMVIDGPTSDEQELY